MGLAICMLQRSLVVGKNTTTVWYNTTRKICSAVNNAWESSGLAENITTFCINGKYGHRTSRAVGRLFWYIQFDQRLHRRLRDQVIQDEAISGCVMKAMTDWLEVTYQQNKDNKVVVEFGVFALAPYLAALRGNKVAMVNLGRWESLEHSQTSSKWSIPMPCSATRTHQQLRGQSNHTHVLTQLCNKNWFQAKHQSVDK